VNPAGPVARAAELAAIGHRGAVTAEEVGRLEIACAQDPDARVRTAALGALLRAAPAAAAAHDAWFGAVADPAVAVRRRAAELAVLRADATTIAAVITLLADRDVTVVEAAAWALGELGQTATNAGAVPALADVVARHRDALAREAAVAALGALGDPEGLPAILEACHDKPAVRRRAVLALAPFEGDSVDEAVAAALTDRDWQVRQAAEDLRS
jgi:HEAT repeat protein